MTSYGVAGLVVVVVGGVLAYVVLRDHDGPPSAFTRVLVPPSGAAGAPEADSGVSVPEPLPGRERASTSAAALAQQPSAAGTAACAADGGDCRPTVRFDCDPRKLRCRRSPPRCAEGQVPSVAGSCFGECVPIDTCRCHGPEQCPLHEQYTCLLSAHHCTPYL